MSGGVVNTSHSTPHLKMATRDRALDLQPVRLDGQRLKEVDTLKCLINWRRGCTRNCPRKLQIARTGEDDALTDHVVDHTRVKRTRDRGTEHGHAI